MANHVCTVVPPYLLSALAASKDSEVSRLAANTLDETRQIRNQRKAFFENKLAHGHRGSQVTPSSGDFASQSIVPDQLLEHIASSEHVDQETRESAANTLAVNRQIRDGRAAASTGTDNATTPVAPTEFYRGVYDMESREQKTQIDGQFYDTTYKLLPGKLIRAEGQTSIDDNHANEAYDNCGKVLDFYKQIFEYHSLDNRNMPIISSVHYKKKFQNAAWLGTPIRQMVYGDGGGSLYNFTACLDVIGHEMTHAVTEFNSMLEYKNEAGALNEHISDVFGIMVKQWVENTTAKNSDWLIGEGCLMPEVTGVALRNMKAPGTAYNSPNNLGKDPQPDSYDGIQAYKSANRNWENEDHGGVHRFSGVPNRAFVLCAEAFEGHSWEKAGRIWWVTVTTHRIPPTCTFLQFADATVVVAEEVFGEDAAKTVRDAWNKVGVKRTI